MVRLFLILFTLTCFAEERKTLCLNMIVKDEAEIICRCLDSVKKFIDYWVIVDTGSTDKTKEIIKAHLTDIPGELYERPWKNWGETRSEAFNLAKGKADYILFMDADDILEYREDFSMPPLSKDLYSMWRGTKDCLYTKTQIVKGDLPWRWVGVTHEYLTCDLNYTSDILEEIRYTSIGDGATRKKGVAKFLKNVELLEEGIKKEPTNSRYAFYLAESYRDSEQPAKALEWFQKRVDMGGWNEEIYWSKLQIGHMLKALGMNANIVIEAYRDALIYRPHRNEARYFLAEMYNQQKNYHAAYKTLKMGDQINKPKEKDSLFNIEWISDYGLDFEMSVAAYYVGKYEEAIQACNAVLQKDDVPFNWKEQIKKNRTFALIKNIESNDLMNGKIAE